MFGNNKLLVKKSNLEVSEMSIEELMNHNERNKFFVFGMLYVKGGVYYDFVPFRDIKARKNNGSGLYKLSYETPSGLVQTIVCDKNTELYGGGENYWDNEEEPSKKWSAFTSIFNIDDFVYIIDSTGNKCKVTSITRIKQEDEPEFLYTINTKTKNVFVNGILVKCR